MKMCQTYFIRSYRQRGVTLLEAMILMVILSLIAVAVGGALQVLAKAPAANNTVLSISNQLMDKMEQYRAMPFAQLTVGTTTGTVTIGTTSYPYSVTIALADAAGDGTMDADFKQISVTLAGRTMTTWVTDQAAAN